MPERQANYADIANIVQLRRIILRLRIAQFAFTICIVTMLASALMRVSGERGDGYA